MLVKEKILTDVKMPFCPGCGHGVSVRNISKAYETLGYSPKDVIMVSDIGCAGLVDPLFATHTIHGLHGRSSALATGVALGLDNAKKKVLVIMGDGGATIGLQHLMETARRNIDMTVVVLNNLLYGMTGGQMSGLSTNIFKVFKHSDDEAAPYDIINLSHQAGAAFSVRVNDVKQFSAVLMEAIETPGFSIVELSSLCVSHGMKKLKEFGEYVAHEEKLVNDRPIGKAVIKEKNSLFKNIKKASVSFESRIDQKIGVVVAGSAGGGIQSAANILAQAGMLAGLYTSKKGEYPITVGTGFSAAEVILSKDPILYTGLEQPEVIIAVTNIGWDKIKTRIAAHSAILIDSQINNAGMDARPFFSTAGKKGAALSAIAFWVKSTGVIPVEALYQVIKGHKHEAAMKDAIDKGVEMD